MSTRARCLLFAVLALHVWSGRAWAEPIAVAGAAAPATRGVQAPTGPSPSALAQRGTLLPANGSVLVDGATGPVSWWAVQDMMAGMLDFSASNLEQYLILTPALPLQPGAAIQVMIGDRSSVSAWLGVGPARVVRRPDLGNTLGVELRERDTAMECCSSLPDYVARRTCFVTRTTGTVVGTVTLASPEEASALTQVLFRVRAIGSPYTDQAKFQPFARAASTGLIWENRADQYCVELDAVEIGTGEVYTYPELSPRCVPHGALGEVGDHHRTALARAPSTQGCGCRFIRRRLQRQAVFFSAVF